MAKSVGMLVLILGLLVGRSGAAEARSSLQQRVQRVKEATVRILINGIPEGTGFAIAANLVATNFHVVQQLSPAVGGQTQIAFADKIEVQLYNGRLVPAAPHSSVSGKNLQTAMGRDVALLMVPVNDLKLGRFSDIAEGDAVYLAGYPLGVEQVIVATGMLSTKWKIGGYLGQGGTRDVAWLDITMNKGNSGGPVLLLAEDPARDVVVGIANFNLNPFAQSAQKLASVAATFPGNAFITGVNFKEFSTLIGKALASQSHGVGGCIAIDYLPLPKL
jgi:serine protease Do